MSWTVWVWETPIAMAIAHHHASAALLPTVSSCWGSPTAFQNSSCRYT